MVTVWLLYKATTVASVYSPGQMYYIMTDLYHKSTNQIWVPTNRVEILLLI
jgi:hypothetical protein